MKMVITTILLLTIVLVISASSIIIGDNNLTDPNLTHQEDPIENDQNIISIIREKSDTPNQRPIIGILAQDYTRSILPPNLPEDDQPTTTTTTKKKQSYIPASYVKLVEGGGGRVVPILSHLGEDYLREMFNNVNGIIFPGGIVSLHSSSYAKAAGFLYQLAIRENDEGIYFPLWGECLGIQWMLFHAAGSPKSKFRRKCDAYNMSVPINFTRAAVKSRLYGNADRLVIKTMKTRDVLPHSHKLCVPVSNFNRLGLGEKYRILGTNYDAAGKIKFVAAAEAIQYPFYALAFHPEKVLYEWWLVHVIAHSSEAVGVAQYHARFLVDESRKNYHQFKTPADERRHLIYNFLPQYTGKYGSPFEQIYLFDIADDEDNS